MPHLKGAVHGVATMGFIIVGGVLTDVFAGQFELFAELSARVAHLLVDVAQLPIEREIAAIVVPVGILVGIWVFLWELKLHTA